MDRVSFSTTTRYCVVELVGLPSNPDNVSTRLTIDLLQCTGVSQAGFDKPLGKWLVNMSDGFTGGTDETKRQIKAALAKHNLESAMPEVEQRWAANVYLENAYPQSQRDHAKNELKRLPEVLDASWHPSYTHIHVTMNTPFSDRLKEQITHIVTGQSPLF